MSGAKYLKVSDSIEAIYVPEDLENNETVTFVKKRWPGKQCLVCAVFMIVLVLAIVFLALFVHQLFKSKSLSNLDKEGTRKSGTNCLSSDCVLAAASKFIRQFFDNFFLSLFMSRCFVTWMTAWGKRRISLFRLDSFALRYLYYTAWLAQSCSSFCKELGTNRKSKSSKWEKTQALFEFHAPKH